MPITKSAIKAMKQANKAKIHNREIKATYKGKIKIVQKEVNSGGKEIEKLASEAFSAIDRAAKNNTIHQKTANRKKSRMILNINKNRKSQLVLASTKDPANKISTIKKAKGAKIQKKKPIVKKVTKKQTT